MRFSQFDPQSTLARSKALDPSEVYYHYKVLGLEPGASEEEIKSKFIIISSLE